MKPRVVIPLSHHEEDTLRLIAHGTCPTHHLRSDDVDQLSKLGLIELHDGNATLTGFGEMRLTHRRELQLQARLHAARQSPLAWHAA